MFKKLLVSVLVFALVSITGFFIVVGVLGATFAGTCASSNIATLQGDDNRAKIYNFWIGNGFTQVQAAGITASIKHESGYSPFRQEMSYSWPSGGYGIAQFTGGQREAVTQFMTKKLGNEFTSNYTNRFGGAVSAENGFVPEGVSEELNDKFLSAQLQYLSEYIKGFKPSSIPVRTRGFEALTGIAVPRDMTLDEFLRSVDSASVAAIAWTFLYEFPGKINSTAIERGKSADEVQAVFADQDVSGIAGACAGGDVVSPTNGDGPLLVTSGAAVRTRASGAVRPHRGIDITTGDTIHAIMEGRVIISRYFGDFGYAVKIDHGNGYETLYAHMVAGSLAVTEGQEVTAGQLLGTMGNTGDSEGVHLHIQLWEDDVLINPFAFFVEHGIELKWSPRASPINEEPGPIPD